MKTPWKTENIPDQTDHIAIVTGANSGIGYETTKALAAKGATVIMACRNLEKANAAAKNISQSVTDADLAIIKLDLANLASVHSFAEEFNGKYDKLNLLINNAGVMIPPFSKTKDGFELQFGANHLGHFALTGLLMAKILTTPKARVINVSSSAHHMGTGTIDFDNLQAEKGYKPWVAYAQSKLANLLFTLELNKRFSEAQANALATASHPGWTGTNLQAHSNTFRLLSPFFAQKPPMGALPSLYAATAPDVQANDYYGPGGWQEMRGYPKQVSSSQQAKDPQLAKRLWEVSEDLIGFKYELNEVVLPRN